MRKIILLVALLQLASFKLWASDTITVMHYNLMYYNHEYDDCNSETNNVHKKNACLKQILAYVQPDVFTVNEVASNLATVNMILDSTLNVNGITKYSRANMVSEQYMTNMIYYNSEKLTLKSQTYASTSPRYTQFYYFEIKNTGSDNSDPVQFTCGVTHLKAGSYPENVTARQTAANVIMNYIDQNVDADNILFMGDLNLYTAEEPAFQILTTPTTNIEFRLYDPLDRVGDWGSNPQFCDVHTQSTRVSDPGCFSYGGMDDRFDFILASEQVLSGSNGLQYETYKALGQDGQRYNQSLISPSNSTVPAQVLNALYNMSDHLPVIMKLCYQNQTGINDEPTIKTNIKFTNPVKNSISLNVEGTGIYFKTINIYNAIGNLIYTNNLNEMSQSFECETSHLNRGFYIVDVLLSNGKKQAIKIIKQ